jgi:hypothetical protein
MRGKQKKLAYVKQMFVKWTKFLGLRWWDITVAYYSDPEEIVNRFTRPDRDVRVVAVTWTDWKYGQAKIDINIPVIVSLSDRDIESAVVHELVHVLVNEMRECEIHHEERVVTQLTKAILWVEQLTIDAIKEETNVA